MLTKLIEQNVDLENKLAKLNEILEKEILPLLEYYRENTISPQPVEDQLDKVIDIIDDNK